MQEKINTQVLIYDVNLSGQNRNLPIEKMDSCGPSDYHKAWKPNPSFSTWIFADINIIPIASFYYTVTHFSAYCRFYFHWFTWFGGVDVGHYFSCAWRNFLFFFSVFIAVWFSISKKESNIGHGKCLQQSEEWQASCTQILCFLPTPVSQLISTHIHCK